jgi:hypothetical protein
MAIDQESFNKRLYDLLKTRGYKPVSKNSNNENIPHPQDADIFEFNFIKDDEDYGKVWATINKADSLEIYYDDTVAGSPGGTTPGVAYDDSWTGLLKQLKQWALSKQLSFELKDMSNIGDDMKQRKWHQMKEKTNESYHAVNKTTSYNDNIPNVKVVIQHDRQIGEGEQRWRNVHKIFVENTEGERFAVPTRMPGIARVYGRHVAEGGTPYDDRGKHITSLVEEYTKMAGFVRATRNGQFNESVAQLIAEGINHHKALKESLQRMQSHRGYNAYFESWTPPLMEDESDSSSIAEMFAQETIDPRIESVLPILNRLNSGIINEIEEVNELDQWAKGITEITEDAEERPYICYHTKKGKHECTASSSYNAAKKAADHWGLKSTAGIDAKLADVEHSPASLEENISDNKPDTIDSEMDAYFGSKPGELEEDSGCACGCGPKSKCTCDASCPKCDCGKDKLEENPLLGMAARAVVGSAVKGAVKGALSSDDKEENDLLDESLNKVELARAIEKGEDAAIEFINNTLERAKGNASRSIMMVKKEKERVYDQTKSADSEQKYEELKAQYTFLKKYEDTGKLRTSQKADKDPLSHANTQAGSRSSDSDNYQYTPKSSDMQRQVRGTLAGPGLIAGIMKVTNPYDKDSTFNKMVGKKDVKTRRITGLAEDDSIDKQHDNQGFTDKEIKMAYGIANDPRYKDGNMSGAIKAIESIKKGLSDHPSVEKVLQATQMEETKSGGMTFAGDYETGPAGQWRNTGKTKGRPAKVGDLVGAESIGDDTYSTGDTVTLRNGSQWTLEVDMTDGTIWATDEDGNEVELDEIVGQIVDHGKPEDRKDHSPDNMPDEIIDEAEMNEMRRLAGLEEAGKPTTNSKHSKERDLKQYDPAHGHTKPEGGNPQVCSCITSSGPSTDCVKCQGTGEIITPKRKDPKVDEAENSPDGNVGADDDGANDKYNQDAETVADRKSIQEDEDLLDIIRSIKL